MKAEGALTPENRLNEVDSFGHTLGVRGPHDLLSTCVSEAHLYARAHQSTLFHSCELPSQTLGAIRSELTENHHAAAVLLRLLQKHRFGGLQVHRNTCATYTTIHACARQILLSAFMRVAWVKLWEQSVQN